MDANIAAPEGMGGKRTGSMTCGVCHPEAFREGDNRVFGYAATDRADISADARKLHYVGAEHIFTDEPKGNVRYRPNLKLLRKLMRPGDKLVVENEQSLGTKPEYVTANVAALEAEGIIVMFIREDYF